MPKPAQQPDGIKCIHCASVVAAGAKFCPACGKPVEVVTSEQVAVALHETTQRQGPVHVVMSGSAPPPPLPPAATADRVKADLIDATIIFGGAWLIGQMV
jgi:hypothetical protein